MASVTPDDVAATSLSRMARKARPVRPRRTSHVNRNASAAVDHETPYSQELEALLFAEMPALPPVNVENFSGSCGIDTARANVASARYTPDRRSAGSPTSTPHPNVIANASGKVRIRFVLW